MKNKKKKRTGGIAIPFLLTFLISMILIGGAALIIYDKISSDESSLDEMKNETAVLTDSDSHTILCILDLSDTVDTPPKKDESSEDDSDEDEDEDKEDKDKEDWEDDEEEEEDDTIYPATYTFMLMRTAPVHKQITIIGLPNNMSAGESQTSVTEIYIKEGAASVKNAVQFTFGVDVDRYMVFDSESFQKLCNIFGGANFVVPGGVEGFSKSSEEQYLGPQQMEKLVSYGGFSGEVQRISTASSLICAMINQASGTRIADNLDSTFETLVDMTDTDITALDYQKMKYGVKFLFKYSEPAEDSGISTRAKFITPYGNLTSKSFDLEENFIKEIQPYFEEKNSEEKKENNSGLEEMIPETAGAKSNNE